MGGAKREITVFFSDLAGFTSLSESLNAEDLVRLLNQYLSAMTDIILRQGGTVDKYEGDAIIAFWNAPLEVSDHQLRAVLSAIECQQALDNLRPVFKQEFGVELYMRIGIHTGVANVGNFGSKDRFNYTIIGDAPNLTSRLEGANKVFGTSILYSKETRQGMHDQVADRFIGRVKVVGRAQLVEVYTPTHNPELTTNFEIARTHFDKGFLEDASLLFAKLEGDPVSKVYLERIRKEINEADFDPTWILSAK